MSDEQFEKWITDNNYRHLMRYDGPGSEQWAREAWQAAIQAERERCAKIAESMIGANRREIADAIRRGGEHEH